MIDPLDSIGALVSRRFGLIAEARREGGALAAVVDARLRAHRVSLEEYAARIVVDPEEQWAVAAAVSNGWTWFFRDRHQLEALASRLAARRSEAPVRVWVAGCSTGEEAYGLAMLCADRGLEVRVTATDLSRARLEVAARGVYDEHATRAVSREERARWLEPVAPRSFRVREELRDRLEARLHNLVDAPPAHRHFDAIVCRNVLIHSTEEGALRIVRGLSQALAPDGELVLGPSDLMQVPIERPPSRPPPALEPPVRATVPESSERVDAAALVTVGNLCVEAHAFDRAEAAYRRAEDLDPCSAELHLAWGVLHRKRGDVERAAVALRRAVFLDETLWPAWALLAGALARLGAPVESERAAEQARRGRLERPWPAWRSHTGRLLLEQLDGSEVGAPHGLAEDDGGAQSALRGGE